jgi:hypothetical protein
LAYVVVATIGVVVQHLVLFQSPILVLGATVAVGLTAYAMANSSLNAFEADVRYQLATAVGGPAMAFGQVQ